MFKFLQAFVGPAAAAPGSRGGAGASSAIGASSVRGTPPAPLAARPAARVTAMPRAPEPARFHAVSIGAPGQCCTEARGLAGHRWLSAEAPSLPLPGCTMSADCHCKFRKHADRRSGEDRRLLGSSESGRWYAGTERRSKGRRKTDV